MPKHPVFSMMFAKVYPLYVQKAERKNRTNEDVDQIICWLTGYDKAGLRQQIERGNDLETFFAQAPAIHPNASLIKGVVCGVRVEDVEDPLMRKIRLLDKLIDELAKGKAMEKILKRMLPLVAIALSLFVARAQDKAAWKPDASDLLFSSTRHGNSEVYVLRAGQTDWVNLTNNEAGDNWPVWSPDGKRIAFQSNRAGNLDIWAMQADGTEQVQLTKDSEPDYLPSWSPDGKTILFTSWRKETGEEQRAPHVYAMAADGSNQRRLVRKSLNTSDGATWSPDGKTIVYSRKGEKGADVYIANSDGTNERRITNDQDGNVYSGSATIAPDGKSIAFYADNEKSAALIVIGIDGKNRRTIVAEGYNWYPRWSPDSRWLVYTSIAPGDDPKNIDVFAVLVTGDAKPILLVGGPKREVEGSWRPR